MIKSIRLQNFFGFQDCTINLEKGENVLVGINGSGKSNFFKALELLVDGVAKGNLRRTFFNTFGGFEYCSFFGSKTVVSITYEFVNPSNLLPYCTYSIYIEPFIGNNAYLLNEKLIFHLSNGKLEYTNSIGQVSLAKTDEFGKVTYVNSGLRDVDESLIYQNNDFWVENLRFEIPGISNYSGFDTSKTSPLRQPVISTLEDTISEKGETLPQVLSYIKNNNRDLFNLIADSLSNVNPNFEGIEFQHVGGKIELRISEKKFNKTLPISNVSDGTIRFLILMTILYSPKKRGAVICIDEPEQGLHPDMINTLYRAIEHAAETSQVIISTHSSHLLDYFELENVRVFEKDKNNATVVNQYTHDDFQGWYDSFLPGQMWRAGDIGGNRW